MEVKSIQNTYSFYCLKCFRAYNGLIIFYRTFHLYINLPIIGLMYIKRALQQAKSVTAENAERGLYTS